MAAEGKAVWRGWFVSATNTFRKGGSDGFLLHVAAVVAFPGRHYLDWHLVLLQLRSNPVLRRNRARRPQRSDPEAGSARLVVVPLGRHVYGDRRRSLPAFLVGPAAGLGDYLVDGGDPDRRHDGNHHVPQRVAGDLARPTNCDCFGGYGSRRRTARPQSRTGRTQSGSGLAHQYPVFDPDALFHGSGQPLQPWSASPAWAESPPG